MGSLSSENWDVKYLLCVADVSPNMLRLNLWKIKKAKKALQVFVKIVNEHKRKTNKLWVDQEREFNNIPMEK